MNTHRHDRGYSLVEMIIYIAILVLVAGLVIEGLLPLARSYRQVVLALAIDGSASAALERMVREIRQASAVSGSSVLNSSPGTLVLTSTDSSGNGTTITFDTSAGAVRIQEGGGAPYNLTGGGVSVSKLIFSTQANGTTSALVGIDMVLSATFGSTTRASEFKTSATLRNSY